jgi:phage baseplate assembly protein W
MGLNLEELVLDSDSINQNLIAIFETPPGSKWFRPELGSMIERFLFEPIDEITAGKIRSEISTVLEQNGEYRLIFNEILVIPDPSNARYYVKITYSVPTLQNRFSFNFNLFK